LAFFFVEDQKVKASGQILQKYLSEQSKSIVFPLLLIAVMLFFLRMGVSRDYEARWAIRMWWSGSWRPSN
jgi:hypothetical protein